MTGTIKRTTPNYALGIPYFDAPGWGSALERNLNIIDAVLGLVSAVPGVVGSWDNNTDYVVGDRVVDTDDDTVWVCNVAHTSASTGTFDDDRTAHPTYWTVVTREIVVRGEVVEGDAYYVGDFVYSEDERIGGVVVNAFTATANLVDNINDLSLIYDLRAFVLPTVTTAGSYLKRNAGNTAYEEKTAAEVGADVASGVANTLGIPAGVADTYLRRNSGNTAYEAKTATQVLADIGGIGGSAGAADNKLVRSDGVGGKTLQSTGITVDDSDNLTTPAALNAGARSSISAVGDSAQLKLERTSSSAGASYLGADSSKLLSVRDASTTEKFAVDRNGQIITFGGQIAFPATQAPSSDANTLDDYEEGTYTPSIIGSTAAGTGTYTERTGKYTKVGRLVSGYSALTWSAHSGTGNIHSDLPFAHNDAGNPVTVYVSSIAYTGMVEGQLASSPANTVQLVKVSEAGTASGVVMTTSGTFRAQFNYITP